MKKKELQLFGIVINMGVTIALSVLVGFFIDKFLKTTPLFIIIFLVLSIGWMFMIIYKIGKRL